MLQKDCQGAQDLPLGIEKLANEWAVQTYSYLGQCCNYPITDGCQHHWWTKLQ